MPPKRARRVTVETETPSSFQFSSHATCESAYSELESKNLRLRQKEKEYKEYSKLTSQSVLQGSDEDTIVSTAEHIASSQAQLGFYLKAMMDIREESDDAISDCLSKIASNLLNCPWSSVEVIHKVYRMIDTFCLNVEVLSQLQGEVVALSNALRNTAFEKINQDPVWEFILHIDQMFNKYLQYKRLVNQFMTYAINPTPFDQVQIKNAAGTKMVVRTPKQEEFFAKLYAVTEYHQVFSEGICKLAFSLIKIDPNAQSQKFVSFVSQDYCPETYKQLQQYQQQQTYVTRFLSFVKRLYKSLNIFSILENIKSKISSTMASLINLQQTSYMTFFFAMYAAGAGVGSVTTYSLSLEPWTIFMKLICLFASAACRTTVTYASINIANILLKVFALNPLFNIMGSALSYIIKWSVSPLISVIKKYSSIKSKVTNLPGEALKSTMDMFAQNMQKRKQFSKARLFTAQGEKAQAYFGDMAQKGADANQRQVQSLLDMQQEIRDKYDEKTISMLDKLINGEDTNITFLANSVASHFMNATFQRFCKKFFSCACTVLENIGKLTSFSSVNITTAILSSFSPNIQAGLSLIIKVCTSPQAVASEALELLVDQLSKIPDFLSTMNDTVRMFIDWVWSKITSAVTGLSGAYLQKISSSVASTTLEFASSSYDYIIGTFDYINHKINPWSAGISVDADVQQVVEATPMLLKMDYDQSTGLLIALIDWSFSVLKTLGAHSGQTSVGAVCSLAKTTGMAVIQKFYASSQSLFGTSELFEGKLPSFLLGQEDCLDIYDELMPLVIWFG